MSTDKLDLQSYDLVKENIEKLAALFPNCVTSEIDGKSIDFDLLKQELSQSIVEGNKERYRIEWPGKKEAIVTANLPTTKTLRPVIEDSVDFDNTENIYIEGDNLDVLKLLQESYLGKIKMIYIDPPYNTGKDFVYKDNFSKDLQDELLDSGQKDELNHRMVVNPETAGRYHSDWLSMIYPRLKLSRNLLTDDGVIFISIDDREQHNVRKLCDEIFGEQNFIAQVIWERAYSPVNLKKHFSESHDYIIIYARNTELAVNFGLPRSKEANLRYSNPDNDPRGDWKSSDLSVGPAIQSNIYEITVPSGRKVMPPSGYSWRLSEDRFNEFKKDNRIWFGNDGGSVPSIKRFLNEVKDSVTPMTIWKYTDVGHSQEASQSLKKLFDNKAYFDYPKPVELIKRCIQLYTEDNSIVLDFFSGSGTTAQATMQLNSENSSNRKFILVQLPEQTDSKSNSYKDGFKTISQLGIERIKRSAKKIKEETGAKIDYGFRIYRLSESNMEDVYYRPQTYKQSNLDLFTNNVKTDRTAHDLLAQVILDWGLQLSLKIEETKIGNKTVFKVAENSLYACFDSEIDEDFAKIIAIEKPLRIVFRDSGFKNDTAKMNVKQLLRQLSPDTEMKVI
jgi:adenine-specific DNA-methyltransferase